MSQRNTGVTVQVVNAHACPVREVLDRVSGKWSVQILVATAHGPIRFTELERSIEGISRRMLTLTLRNLERDGLVTRPAPAAPPARGAPPPPPPPPRPGAGRARPRAGGRALAPGPAPPDGRGGAQ